MKIKSFFIVLNVASMETPGEVLRVGLEDLDRWTNELKATTIHSVDDMVISMGSELGTQYLSRRVIYTQ